ncbi:TetR family transcriptional regulator C-terminal domain-containing protein [Nonomuraea sp. NPDC048916]|uniref:TetR/AcrR family transcriptional regulator n=1 Tax=Nonomuraea sp. NPDC048916 TaxID=3154232 RepID=UPI0033EA82E1
MPKVVDPAERRLLLAEAVLRVMRRDGLEQASVRNVAREAGLSMGSLRHYFASQSELMVFAFRTVIDRIESRLTRLEPEPAPRRRAQNVLTELLPLDEERQAENEVWLAFASRAMVDPLLEALRDEGYDALRAGCQAIVADLSAAGLAPTDVSAEAERLHALLDGLAVHAAMRPDIHTAESLTTAIARHLDALATERASQDISDRGERAAAQRGTP